MPEDFIPDPSLNPDAAADFIPDPSLNANVDFIPDPSLNSTPDETLAGSDEADFIAAEDLSNEWIGPKTKAPLETINGSAEYATLVSGKKPAGFWGNLFDVSSKDIPFTGDFESAAELGKMLWIGRKIEAKEDVKDEDLVKFNTFLAMRKQQGETGWLGKAGATVREAATFGLEIAAVSGLGLLSGGAGAVAGGAEMTGAKGAVKGLRLAAEKMTDKFLVARFGEKLGGAAAKIATGSGRILSDTLVLDAFRAGAIKNEIAERKLADMLAGKEEDKNAAMMSIANWSVEHASEMSGEYLGAMVGGLFNRVGGKAISSALKNEMMKAQIFRAIASKFNVTRFNDVMGVMKNLGYHGVINEMYEERAGDFVRGLTGIDGKAGLVEAFKRAVPTWEQFKIESVAFAVPGIAHTAIGFTGATGVNPLELQKNFDLVSKAISRVQTRDEILKTSGDLAERIHQERSNPWNRQFNFLGRLFNTANKGTAEDLLARANIKGVLEAYDAAPQGQGKEAVMDFLANKAVGIKVVDTEEQKKATLDLLEDNKLVGYMRTSENNFNYYLKNKEFLSDPATLKLAQETGLGFIKSVDEIDDTAVQALEASHVKDAESVGRLMSARNNAEAEEIRGTLQAALKDPDIAGRIKYGLPMIIKGTRKQYEDANIGYTIAPDAKPMQDERGDPLVDADGNSFYAMTSRGVTTNSGLILNKNSRLQDVKEEIHHLLARTALKNGQHSGEAARWAAQTRSTLESIVATSQDEAKVSRAKALLGFSDFELIEKTHLYAVQDNKATDSTNMVFDPAGMKELGILPDQRFDDYFTKLTNNRIHILRTKPRVAPAKPGVADTMVRDLVGSSVKDSIKMAKDIVGHVLETEVKDALLVDLYLALKGRARRRNAKTPQPNIQRIDQVLQDMSDRGFTYSLTENELRRKIAAYTKWMVRSKKGYKYLNLSDDDKFKRDLQELVKLEKQLEKVLKEKDRVAMKEPAKQKVKRPSISEERDKKKHKQWGDTLPVKIYKRLFNGESEEVDIGEVTPDDFRNVVSDEDAARLIPQFYWDIAPVTMGEFAANFFYQYNKGRPDAPTDLEDLAIRVRIEAKLNEVNKDDIPEFDDIVDDLRLAQFAAGQAYRVTVKGERTGKDSKPVIQTSGGVIGARESAVEAERELEAKRALEEAGEDYEESEAEDDLTPADRLIARQVQLPSQVEASKMNPPQLPEKNLPFANPNAPLGHAIKNIYTVGHQINKEVKGSSTYSGIATPYDNIKVTNLSASTSREIQAEYDRLSERIYNAVNKQKEPDFNNLDFGISSAEARRLYTQYVLAQKIRRYLDESESPDAWDEVMDMTGLSSEAISHLIGKSRFKEQSTKVLGTIQENKVQLVVLIYNPKLDSMNGHIGDLARQLAITGKKHEGPVAKRLDRFGEEQPELDDNGKPTGRILMNQDPVLAGIEEPLRIETDLTEAYHSGVIVVNWLQAASSSVSTHERIAQRIHDSILRNNAKNIMIIMNDDFDAKGNPKDVPYKNHVSMILKMALGTETAGKRAIAPAQAPVEQKELPQQLKAFDEDMRAYYRDEIDRLMKERTRNPVVADPNTPEGMSWAGQYKFLNDRMQKLSDDIEEARRLQEPQKQTPSTPVSGQTVQTPAQIAPGARSPATGQRGRSFSKISHTPVFDTLPSYEPGQSTLTYTGIGSRETPKDVLDQMTEIAKSLEKQGYTLRSGGAEGADSAFERGTKEKEIYKANDATDKTRQIAKEIHPAPDRLGSGYVLDLMARNTFQVFGKNLDTPSDFVLAWTPDGMEQSEQRSIRTGGTGQAIDMASRKGIPVLNMATPNWKERLQQILGGEYEAPKTTAMTTEIGKRAPLVQQQRSQATGQPSEVYGIRDVLIRSDAELDREMMPDDNWVALSSRRLQHIIVRPYAEIQKMFDNKIWKRMPEWFGSEPATVDEFAKIVIAHELTHIKYPQLSEKAITGIARATMMNDPFLDEIIQASKTKTDIDLTLLGSQATGQLGRSFEIVKLAPGQKAPAGVFDGHRAGKMNATNAAPGAPGALGNPFIANDVRGGQYTREEATRLFEQVFLKRVNEDPAYREWVLSLRGGKVGYYKPTEEFIHLQAVQKWLEQQPDTVSTQRAKDFGDMPKGVIVPRPKNFTYSPANVAHSPEVLLSPDELQKKHDIDEYNDFFSKSKATKGKRSRPKLEYPQKIKDKLDRPDVDPVVDPSEYFTGPVGWARTSKGNYEVSSKGDKRFSALEARLRDGRTIEEAYQLDVKGYRKISNDWRIGKGKRPLNNISEEEAWNQYKALWNQFLDENPDLEMDLIRLSTGRVLTDRFAYTDVSQARALYELIGNAESLKEYSMPEVTMQEKYGTTDVSEIASRKFGPPGARFANMRPLSDVMPSAERQDYSLTPAEELRQLTMQRLKDAGWDTRWPIVIADLTDRDKVDAIKSDPSLSQEEKDRILSFVPGGEGWNKLNSLSDYSFTHDQIYNTVARMLYGPERKSWFAHSTDLDRIVADLETSFDPEQAIQNLVAQATVNNANTSAMIDTLAAQIRSWHDKQVNLERFGEDVEDYSLTAEDFRAGAIASLTFADDLIPITPWLFAGSRGMHDRYIELIRRYKAHVDADMMHFSKWLMEAGLHPDSKFYKKMSRTQRTVATRMLEAVGAILEGSDMVIRERSRSLSQYESELYAMYKQMQDKALELSRAGKKTEAASLAESAKDLLAEGKHNLAVWVEKGFTHEPPVGESAQRMLDEWNKTKLPGQWTAQGFRDSIRQAFDNNRRIANKEVAMLSQGEWIEELKSYITHMYKRGKAMTEQEFEEAKRKFVESSARAEKRRYPTYADAATHGLVPITQNAAQLFKMWGTKVWSLQARKLFLASAVNIRDADGSPMLIAIKRPKYEGEGIIDKRTLTEADSLLRKFIDDHNAALPKSRQHEALQLDANGELDIDVMKELGYVQYASPFNSIEKFWVKDGDALNVMKMLLDKKKEWRPFGGRDWAKGIDTFNSFTKSALLFISAFHPFSLLESFFAAQGLTFKNDLFHLGRFYRNKQDMIKKFQTDEAFVGKWVKHGFGIGHTDPNINQGIVDQNIQAFIDTLKGDTGEEGVLSSMTQYVFDIKKGWDRWLWDEFQPALKLMTAERMLEEERAKAEAAGTKFDEDGAMEQISAVTNKMFGGVEFEKYIWATPKARQLLHALMFAPDWTFAAAEQGLITQLPLLKQMLRSPNLGEIEAAALRKFWIAMGTLVLVGIPNALQAAIYAATGNPDDGDKPFTFQNEQGKITHIDVTPLVRMMSGVPIVGYEGGDTGKRRVYMRWGKQAYEIGGWFTEPVVTALNKSSMVVHTAWEQATGTATSGFPEEFKDEGLLGVFSSRGEFLKGRIGTVVAKFMPMNILSVIQDKPAGWFATASRGKTLGSVIQDMGDVLEAYADQGIAAKLKGIPNHVDKLGLLVDDIVDAGRRNGVDVEEAFKRAQNIAATKYYTIFFKALNKSDTRKMEEAAEAILRLNKGRLNIIRSMKSRLDVSGKGMTPETYSQISSATDAALANIINERNRRFKPARF